MFLFLGLLPLCVSVGDAHSAHMASDPNNRASRYRETWHRSLHSITWSHDSRSRTHGLMHFTHRRNSTLGRAQDWRNKQSPLCIEVFLSNGIDSCQRFGFTLLFNGLPPSCFVILSAVRSPPFTRPQPCKTPPGESAAYTGRLQAAFFI